MTLLIFHQKGSNLRLGNVIKWSGSAMAWCEDNNYLFYYPAAKMILQGVLSAKSDMLDVPERLKSSDLFSPGVICSKSQIISFIDNLVALTIKYGSKEELSIDCLSMMPGRLGFIGCGNNIDWESKEIKEFIESHRMVVINEPFPFNVISKNLGKVKKRNWLPSRQVVELEARASVLKSRPIGIHVRQTDYKTYCGGKYYKDCEFYNEVIKGIVSHFGKSREYFIGHDGEFELSEELITKPSIKISDGKTKSSQYDFASFMTCEYIIGPESTFTRQAMELGWLWFSRPARIIVIQPDDSAKSVINRVIEEINSDFKNKAKYKQAIERKINTGRQPG